ncbi:serine-threonine protein kinase 19-domain-containing protein [Phycomyces nitens]|nr:serine-threonine protein kinase 19-domain-containing protein [Phycomyces nitens]
MDRKRARQTYDDACSTSDRNDCQIDPDAYGIKKKAIRKRLKKFEDNEFADEFGDDLPIVSDGSAAADYLIKKGLQSTTKIGNSIKARLPICFIHQIYDLMPNYTAVDRDLYLVDLNDQEVDVNNGLWCSFRGMDTFEDETILMATPDYVAMIEKAKITFEKEVADGINTSGKGIDPNFFDRFKRLIETRESKEKCLSRDVLMKECCNQEEELIQLVKAGVLLPHLRLNLYWVSIPGQGMFFSDVRKGREEILQMLKKRPTKDMFEKMIQQKVFKKTSIGYEFLLHDLVGSGRAERHHTPMGDLIRLTRKGLKSS